ncbi:hypothetical protein D1159_00225 [Pseudoflavonifractor sp. 524-17]|nr:hypothetical protein [Pseudoflavonifractor sp. 524-17]
MTARIKYLAGKIAGNFRGKVRAVFGPIAVEERRPARQWPRSRTACGQLAASMKTTAPENDSPKRAEIFRRFFREKFS